jgi:prepilin signal peptidase PulO-like enzyme (type II secretory pathway)
VNVLLTIPLPLRLLALFVAGVVVGSLANLGVYQLGWNCRAVSPWSRPAAGTPPRRWWDRLPVAGWLGLRREAGLHGRGFWLRPMLLELAGGTLFALLYWWEIEAAGLLPPDLARPLNRDVLSILHHQYAAHVVLLSFMWMASWIDLDEKTIPDTVTVPGTLAALALAAIWPTGLLPDVRTALDGRVSIYFVILTSPNDVQPWLPPACTGLKALALGLGCYALWCIALLPRSWYPRHGCRRACQLLLARLVRQRSTCLILAIGLVGSAAITGVWKWGLMHWSGLLSALVGLAVGGGIVWIVRVLGSSVLGREAMGFGDVTLMAMLGAMLGWQAAVIIFFLAPLLGIVVGLVGWAVRGQSEIPYGPFLCLAAMTTIVGWAPIWGHFQPAFALGWWLLAVLAACLAMIVVLLPLVRAILSLFRRN